MTPVLLIATFVLAAAAILPRLHWHHPLWLRVSSRLTAFVVLTVLVQRAVGSPLSPRFDASHPGLEFWQQVVEAGWWLVGARVAVGLLRLLVVLEHRPRETQIISDLLAGVIYVATVLAIINFAFVVPIRGLLATSGVIAIVLGLALQSTLADVFSGIAVGIERPYRAGDLLRVEGGVEGHVLQVNWRSTQIATGDNDIAVVPNSIIAKSRLVNLSAPTPVRGDTVKLLLDAGAAPERCIETLRAALLSCRLPLDAPASSIACTGLQGDGVRYEISYSVPDSDHLVAARTELFSEIHRHLRHAGIALGVPTLAVPPPVAVPDIGRLLAQSELFGVLEADERAALAARFTELTLQPGETLIREKEMPQALYLIASGAVEISRAGQGGKQVLARMSPGESLGAFGLITDQAYSATATALTKLCAFRLDKAAITAAIAAQPSLAAALEALAKRGQAALRRDVMLQDDTTLAQPEMFLERVRSFLRLLGT